jgi:hypothetical protein
MSSPGFVYTAGEFLPAVFDLSNQTLAVTSKRCVFRGLRVSVSPSAAVTISSGGVTLDTIRAAELVGADPYFDVYLANGLTLSTAAGQTGRIVVFYLELP